MASKKVFAEYQLARMDRLMAQIEEEGQRYEGSHIKELTSNLKLRWKRIRGYISTLTIKKDKHGTQNQG